MLACIGKHLIHDFKIAVVLGQVQMSIAKALLRMVPVLDLNIVSVRPVEDMLIDDSLLGLRPLVGVQLVEIADLLAQRLLVDEGLLPRVPLRSGLQSIRRPSFGLAGSRRVWMVPGIDERLLVSCCLPVVAGESAVSLDQVLASYVAIVGQVRSAYYHIVGRRPVRNLPLTLDHHVTILERVPLLGKL